MQVEKQLELQKSRNNAQRIWLELKNAYSQMHPEYKAEVHQSISQIANRYTRLRDITKEMRQQRGGKTVSAEKSNYNNKDPLNETLESVYQETTTKALAQNFLRKGRGQGGGQTEGTFGSSPKTIIKESKLVEDLNKIKELNSIMRLGQHKEQSFA